MTGHSSDIKSSNKPGLINGLQIQLFLDDPVDFKTLSQVSGAHIYVNNKSIAPSQYEGN